MLIKDVDSSSRVKKTVRFEEHDVGVKPFIPRRKTIEDLGKHVLSPGNVKQDKVISPDRMTRRQSISPEKPLKTPPITVTRQAGLDWSKDGQKKAQFLYRNKPGKVRMGLNTRKPVFVRVVNNIGADQPAHLRSLISAFVNRLPESIISKLFSSEISIF